MMPRTRKQFGQHWLRSDKVLNRILAAAELSQDDSVLEIGPGTGILTKRLLAAAQSVVAVEIDRDLCQLLRQKLGQVENFLLLEGDVLALDLEEQLAQFPDFRYPNKVVANIPYNITGPILEKLLGTIAHPYPRPFDSLVLLMQKEVAERICAAPGSKIFGALSVRVQYLADSQWICTVPAGAFQPPPKVESAVIRLHPRSFQPVVTSPATLDTLVKLGFATKRKMLRNNLKTVVDRDRLTHYLEQVNQNPQARAEDLGVQEWVALSNWVESDGQVSYGE